MGGWRTDPRLAKARDQALPDVVKARFFFPEFGTWELLGVTIDGPNGDGWEGHLVERPVTAPDVVIPGERVVLRHVLGQAHPVRVTEVMRENLARHQILCAGCGLDVHGEPIADVWARQADGAAMPEVFTTRCPACKGTMFVAAVGVPLPHEEIRALSARGRTLLARERPDVRPWMWAGVALVVLSVLAVLFALAR